MKGICPTCGRTDTKRRVGAERVCRSCGTRFTAPTPLWERSIFALVFFVGVFIFGAIGVGIIAIGLNVNAVPVASSRAIGCGSMVLILALLCLVQGVRELIGRGKNPREQSEVNSSVEVVSTDEPDVIPSAPPLVPQKQAVSLVREIAEKHGAKGILRMLGQFREDHLANAAAHFAQAMHDDETPLALLDTSVFHNGKAGLLITNRGVYSSFCRRPIWLADIEDVLFARPGFDDFLVWYFFGIIYVFIYGFRRFQNRLVVNGTTVYLTGNRLRGDFWIELLTALADAARQMPTSIGVRKRKPELVVLETSLSLRGGEAIEVRRTVNPMWQQVEQSIRDLDRDGRPSLRIWAGEVERAPALDILGGNGKYVLRELGDGWIFYDPSQGEEEVEICPGLVGHRFPAFYVCADLKRVLQIARHYFETGTPE